MTRVPSEPAARIDCHIHSQYSPDGRGSLKELAAMARTKGLTGLCVTDHNTLRIAQDMKASEIRDLTLIPGIEVSTQVGHCLALGVRTEIPRGLPLPETLEAIVAAGGVGVPSHPFRRIHGVGEAQLSNAAAGLRAIETYNARDGTSPSNHRAAEFARTHRLGGTGGSDAHQIFEVGNAHAAFPHPIESQDDFVDQIRKGRTWGQGAPTPKTRLFIQNLRNLWLFSRRGFRGI